MQKTLLFLAANPKGTAQLDLEQEVDDSRRRSGTFCTIGGDS
jgi:hypothetical protein